MNTLNLKFVRLERPSTHSFMTLAMPRVMDTMSEVQHWVKETFPGWTLLHASSEQPVE